VNRRFPVLCLIALLVSGAGLWAAIALPPACPAGFHPYSATYCESDATHIAPSSGVRIPIAMAPYDARAATKVALAVGSLAVGAVLVAIGLPRRGPEGLIA
jgi:hypothetical protein